MTYLEECLQAFRELPDFLRNQVDSPEAFQRITAIEDEYGVDLKFLVILLAIGELSFTEIANYLMDKEELAEEDAMEIEEQLSAEIFVTGLDTEALDQALREDEFDDALEESAGLLSRESILEIIQKEVAEYFNEGAEKEKTELLNNSIFYEFSRDGSFQGEIVKALLANQQEITSKRLKIGEKEGAPTIANWLEDFFEENGVEDFNDLVLIQYLNHGANVKGLSTEDKEKVKNLLRAYRNLSFFPDSLAKIPIENWQLIPEPTEKGLPLREEKKTLTAKGPVAAKTQVPKEQLGAEKKSQPEAKKMTATERQLAELAQALDNYPVNSLERKAIEQEIKRLQKTK